MSRRAVLGRVSWIKDLIFVFYMLALARCWNLLAGYAGLVSVGQQAFVGLGGYLLFALTIGAGIDPIAAVVLSGLVAALFAGPSCRHNVREYRG
jgi:branched-chain amino acid transport system permease protein